MCTWSFIPTINAHMTQNLKSKVHHLIEGGGGVLTNEAICLLQAIKRRRCKVCVFALFCVLFLGVLYLVLLYFCAFVFLYFVFEGNVCMTFHNRQIFLFRGGGGV